MRYAQPFRVKLEIVLASLRTALIVIGGALLGSCAFVDNYGQRIYQNNLTFQDANSQEALLNIIRASRYEALSFVGIGQESGSQTESLNAGLPTFIFGPGQTAAQKQFAFGSNSLTSSAMGSYQVSPIVTSNFMQGMLTPVTPKVLALLLGTFPREWMYFAALQGIKLTGNVKQGNAPLAFYFRNDPADDQYNGIATNDQCSDIIAHSNFGSPIYNDDSLCNFSKFANALSLAVEFGLTSEILLPDATTGANSPKQTTPPKKSDTTKTADLTTNATGGTNSPSQPQGSSPGANLTSTPNSIGHLCWDPVLALSKYREVVQTKMTNVCGRPASAKPQFGFDFGNVNLNVQFIFRSPYGMYRYLGTLLRENSARRIHFLNIKTFEERELNSGPFLNISQGINSDCLVTAFYNGETYCVPRKGSNSTAVILDILGQLKNLSVTPADLNAAFSVRLIN